MRTTSAYWLGISLLASAVITVPFIVLALLQMITVAQTSPRYGTTSSTPQPAAARPRSKMEQVEWSVANLPKNRDNDFTNFHWTYLDTVGQVSLYDLDMQVDGKAMWTRVEIDNLNNCWRTCYYDQPLRKWQKFE